jgi:hypothetical protein
MTITAIHGDGARRIKYEYRPSTWLSHAIQAACGIQYHKVIGNRVRPGLYYRGWRWSVQKFCFGLERIANRWI